MSHSRAFLGQRGERRAAWHAFWRGACPIARNVRGPAGEVDLILWHWARRRPTLVFAEVKTRVHRVGVWGLRAVDAGKQARIRATAESWLAARGWPRVWIRYDLFLVPAEGKIDWIQGAFEHPER